MLEAPRVLSPCHYPQAQISGILREGDGGGGGSHRCVVSESKPRAVSGITAWSLYHLIFISLLKCVAFFPPCTFGEEGNRSLPLSGWSNSTYCVFYLYMGYAAPYPCIE